MTATGRMSISHVEILSTPEKILIRGSEPARTRLVDCLSCLVGAILPQEAELGTGAGPTNLDLVDKAEPANITQW